MVRISGTAVEVGARHIIYPMALYAYCNHVGGRPKEIASNPGGMNIVTIPKEEFEKFKVTAHDYNLQYFKAENRMDLNATEVDICIKMEDTSVLHRVLERCEIGVVKEMSATQVKNNDLVINNLSEFKGKTFEEVAESLKSRSETMEQAFNRHTTKDFARDTPYYICDRNNPQNYVKLISTRDTYAGEEYTKTRYTVYRDGKHAGEFNDGRFDGRSKDYWQKTRESIQFTGDLSDDLLYFGDEKALSDYTELYKGRSEGAVMPDQTPTELSVEDLDIAAVDFEKEFALQPGEEIPKTQAVLQEKSELKHGLENGNTAKKQVGVKAWVTEKEKELAGKAKMKNQNRVPVRTSPTPKPPKGR